MAKILLISHLILQSARGDSRFPSGLLEVYSGTEVSEIPLPSEEPGEGVFDFSVNLAGYPEYPFYVFVYCVEYIFPGL